MLSDQESEIVQALKQYDTDENGKIDPSELAAILQDVVKERKSKQSLKWLLMGSTFALVILLLSVFSMTLAVVNLTREIDTDDSSNQLVSTEMGEMLSTRSMGGGGTLLELNMVGSDDNTSLRRALQSTESSCVGQLSRTSVEEAWKEATERNTQVRVQIHSVLRMNVLVDTTHARTSTRGDTDLYAGLSVSLVPGISSLKSLPYGSLNRYRVGDTIIENCPLKIHFSQAPACTLALLSSQRRPDVDSFLVVPK